MTTRRSLTRAQKVRVFDAARGRCHICCLKIQAHRGEAWEIEHKTPLWLGGLDILENMAPAHVRCHADKTSCEATDRAKTYAVRADHLFVPKPGPKLPAGRKSDMKKKISGEVVSRPPRGSEHGRVMAAYPNWRGE